MKGFNEAYKRLCELYGLATEKPKGSSWQGFVESRTQKKIEAVYEYYSTTDGSYAYTKLRLTDKQIVYGILNNGRFSFGIPRNKPRKSYNALYGNLQAIKEAIAGGQPIFITEGEKDTDTMTKQNYIACTYGGSNDWVSGLASFFQGAVVIVLADNDKPGLKVAGQICEDLKGIAKSIKMIVPLKDKTGADITDFFEAGHHKQELEAMIADTNEIEVTNEIVVTDNIFSLLVYKKDSKGQSKIVQSVRNFETVLEHDERFANRIRFDCFASQTYLMGGVPWEQKENCRPWGSYDDSALFAILQADYGLTSRNDFFDAVKNVSMKNRFHPVRDLLESLEWDGQEYINNLLPDYLGAEKTDYNNEVMRLFMLGAVSRIFKPGCKFDYTMILQGRQGIGKSTFLQLLALDDAWFNDSLDSLDSDKSAQSLMGTWIVELAELKSLARTAGGVDSVKRFLTATQDKYRRPYERRADVFPRQCVFSGSTNKSDFLQDETGNRRFLIVETGINEPVKSLFTNDAMADIKQAWAQAVHIYKTEQPSLILSRNCQQKAEELQAESMSDDGKIGLITEYLASKTRTCAIEIWQKCLKEQGRPQKWQAGEINNIILGIPGWKKMKSPTRFSEYGNQRGFQRDCSTGFQKMKQEEIDKLPFD